jgi:hypothetical protein
VDLHGDPRSPEGAAVRRDRPEISAREGVAIVAWVPGTPRKALQVSAVHPVAEGLGPHVLVSPWMQTRRGAWFPTRRGIRVPISAVGDLIAALETAATVLRAEGAAR